MTAEPLPAGPAPDLIQRVVGYRLWRLADDGLRSPYIDERWPWGVHTAVCRAEGPSHADAAPAHDCTCGIYAWYEPRLVLGLAATRDLVAGAVGLWGEVELHSSGMRARHAMVLALVVPPWRGSRRRWISDVASAHDAKAVRARHLKAEALRHAAPVPASMVPRARGPQPGSGVRTGLRPIPVWW